MTSSSEVSVSSDSDDDNPEAYLEKKTEDFQNEWL
jgi:hypothetical protein